MVGEGMRWAKGWAVGEGMDALRVSTDIMEATWLHGAAPMDCEYVHTTGYPRLRLRHKQDIEGMP